MPDQTIAAIALLALNARSARNRADLVGRIRIAPFGELIAIGVGAVEYAGPVELRAAE